MALPGLNDGGPTENKSPQEAAPMGSGDAAPCEYGPIDDRDRMELVAIRDKVQHGIRAIARDAIAIGEALLRAQKIVPRGFARWVTAECAMSVRSARNYMGAARLIQKEANLAVLPLTGLYPLAGKRTPPEVVHEVVERVKSGRVPSAAEIIQLIKCARPPSPRRKGVQDARLRPEPQSPLSAPAAQALLDPADAADLARLLIEQLGRTRATFIHNCLGSENGRELLQAALAQALHRLVAAGTGGIDLHIELSATEL
jgi:hypothetical protein